MSKECIFCKIIRGEIPCCKVYEDSKVLVFLDIQPVSKGHMLVMPKEHFENIYEIDEQLYGYMYQVVKKMAYLLKCKYKPEGIHVNQNNGKRAGQSVGHIHVHVKPIYIDTPPYKEEGHRLNLSSEEMDKILSELKTI